MQIEGKVIKYGDNINTDEIIPTRYLVTTDPEELGKHCMEGKDPDFLEKIKERKIIVAGKNFGSGSSREHAPLALKGAGVKAIVAESFARIFFRNSLNMGLIIVESKEASRKIEGGEKIRIDLEGGKIENLDRKEVYSISPFPLFLQELIKKGGLEGYVRGKLNESKNL